MRTVPGNYTFPPPKSPAGSPKSSRTTGPEHVTLAAVPDADRSFALPKSICPNASSRPRIDKLVYPNIRNVSKSVRISEEFHEFVKAHKREDETMEETLRRLIGGPHPEDVAGILSSETAESMRDQLEKKRKTDVEGKRELRERFG